MEWIIVVCIATLVIIVFLQASQIRDLVRSNAEANTRIAAELKKQEEIHTQTILSCEKSFHLQLSDLQSKHDIESKMRDDAIRSGLQNLTSDLKYFYSFNYLYKLSGAPDGSYVDETNLPKSGNCESYKWGENYTFFATIRPTTGKKKYHKIGCQYCAYGHQINAHTIRRNRLDYSACSVCKPELPNTTWVDYYVEHKRFLDEYMGEHKSRVYNERLSDR